MTLTTKTKRQLQTERRATFFNGVNFVYGYETHKGQKRPTVTVAIVPEMVDGQLYFGIGVARCAPIDIRNNMLTKAAGRARATARARAVLKMNGWDINGKPDDIGYCRILGTRAHWETMSADIDSLLLSNSLTERVMNCADYLVGKFYPSTPAEA